MPSQPIDTGWNFSSVIDLIGSDVHSDGSPTLRPLVRPQLQAGKEARLGSFVKLFQSLGIDVNAEPITLPLSTVQSELQPEIKPEIKPEIQSGSKSEIESEIKLQAKPEVKSGTKPEVKSDVKAKNKSETKLEINLENKAQSEALKKATLPFSLEDFPPSLRHKIPLDLVRVESTDTTTDEPVESQSDDTKPVLSKKQRQKQRKRAEKARLEAETKDKGKKALAGSSLVDTLDTTKFIEAADTLTSDQAPVRPSRTASRSNVGAKIIHTVATPQLDTSISPTPKTLVDSSNAPLQPVPSIVPDTVSPPVTPSPQRAKSPGKKYRASHTTSAPVQFSFNGSHGLVPRTVRPVTVNKTAMPHSVQPPTTPSPAVFQPPFVTPARHSSAVTLRSQVDRHFHLFNKLVTHFPDDKKWLVAPRQLVNESTTNHGIHVFVDASNIMIGFKDMLRNHGITSFDMSFDSLALIMERRRPVAKRVFVGSHREANPLPQITKLVETSKAVGYESNVKEQVYIAREESHKRKFFNDVKRLGWQKATALHSGGSGSDSETGPNATAATPKTATAPKWVEQGVDELLHLKMCQSIIDAEEPATIVLATGDGAEAEMSDGFLAHVERALRNGWNVELISWRQQTNGGYKKKAFRTKWADQFSIIELDEFLEDLIDTP